MSEKKPANTQQFLPIEQAVNRFGKVTVKTEAGGMTGYLEFETEEGIWKPAYNRDFTIAGYLLFEGHKKVSLAIPLSQIPLIRKRKPK